MMVSDRYKTILLTVPPWVSQTFKMKLSGRSSMWSDLVGLVEDGKLENNGKIKQKQKTQETQCSKDENVWFSFQNLYIESSIKCNIGENHLSLVPKNGPKGFPLLSMAASETGKDNVEKRPPKTAIREETKQHLGN